MSVAKGKPLNGKALKVLNSISKEDAPELNLQRFRRFCSMVPGMSYAWEQLRRCGKHEIIEQAQQAVHQNEPAPQPA